MLYRAYTVNFFYTYYERPFTPFQDAPLRELYNDPAEETSIAVNK